MNDVSRKYAISLSLLAILSLTTLATISVDPDLTGLQSASVYLRGLGKVSGAFVLVDESSGYRLEGVIASGGIVGSESGYKAQIISSTGAELEGSGYKLVLWPMTTGTLSSLPTTDETFYCIEGQSCTFTGSFSDVDVGTEVTFGWALFIGNTEIDFGTTVVTIPDDGQVSRDFTGTFDNSGTYTLTFVVTDDGVETTTDADMHVLIPGDINKDSKVCFDDIESFVDVYGKGCNDAGYNSLADISLDLDSKADCSIDFNDVERLVDFYGEGGC